MFSRILVMLTFCSISLNSHASQKEPNPLHHYNALEYLSTNPLNKRYSYAQIQEWQFDKQYSWIEERRLLAIPPSVKLLSGAACSLCGGILGGILGCFVDILRGSSSSWFKGCILGTLSGLTVCAALPYNAPLTRFECSASINEIINEDRAFPYYMLKHHPEIITLIGKYKKTALILAAKKGSFNAVKSLLAQKNINIHHKDELGWTALHYAVNYGHEEAVKSLLKAGATIDKEAAVQLTNNKLGDNKTGKIRALLENR